MQQVVNDATPNPNDGSHGILGVAKHYFLTEWPSAILVAAVVFILHHYSSFFKAVDDLPFGVVVNIIGKMNVPPPRVLVIEIDQASFETRYREKSPLDRCKLHEDLLLVYSAKPALVVIDLDLSPVHSDRLEKVRKTFAATSDHIPAPGDDQSQESCQSKIDNLISNSKSTSTVLMEPFDVTDQAQGLKTTKRIWREKFQEKFPHVRFGRAEVPVTFGMVIKQYHAADNLAVRAREAVSGNGKGTEQCNHKELARIDPRSYIQIHAVSLSTLREKNSPAKDLEALLMEATDLTEPKRPRRVIFFGGAYGKDDIFLTPVGNLWGVEVQAASYLSEGIHARHIIDLLLDIFLAIVFGVVIAYCWYRYFGARTDPDAGERQRAPIWIIFLLLSVMVVVFFSVWFSSSVLAKCFVWISPLPIALGMLFDSFISGTVEQATGQMRIQKQAWLAELESSAPYPRESWLIGFLNNSKVRQPIPPKNITESVRRMLGGDIRSLYARQQYYAMTLLAIWTAVWFLIVTGALWIALAPFLGGC